MRGPAFFGSVAVVSATAASAFGQENEQAPRGTGIAGGALLGAELVVLGQAIAGVEPAWAYAVGGALGAGAGAWAGYRVEEQADRDAAIYVLSAGMILVIPTAVWLGTLRARRSDPELVPLASNPWWAPGAPVRLSEGRWSLGVPTLELHQPTPIVGFDARRTPALHLPIANATF